LLKFYVFLGGATPWRIYLKNIRQAVAGLSTECVAQRQGKKGRKSVFFNPESAFPWVGYTDVGKNQIRTK
jgi:hypothetical protein